MADCSYQFLSSLSPRINPNGKKKYKGPTLLSLKQQIRRSSHIDKPRTIPNEHLSIVEISSTESSSDNTSRLSKSPNTKPSSLDEIEASPLQNERSSHISLSSQEEFISPSPQKNVGSFTCLSTTKKNLIRKNVQSTSIPRKNLFGVQKWLEDVEKATIEHKTEVSEPSIMSYEDFEKKSYEQIASSTMVPDFIEDKGKVTNTNQITDDDSDDEGKCDKSCENLLDDLYGNAWRLKRDEIFPNSEKKVKVKSYIERKIPETERKPIKSDTFRKPCMETPKLKSKDLLRNFQIQKKWIKKVEESPIIKKLKDICDEETDEESFTRNNNEDAEKNNVFIDKILDDSLNDDCYKSDINISTSDKENFIEDEIIPLKERIERKWNKSEKASKEKNTSIKQPKNKKIFKSTKQNQCDDSGEFNSVKKLGLSTQNFVPNTPTIAPIHPKNKWRSASPSSTNSDEDDAPYSRRNGGISCKSEKTLSFLASLSKDVPSSKCDFSAKIYKNSYKQYKVELAKKLFNLFNEKIFGQAIPENTNLEWSERMLRTAGFCYSKKIIHKTGVVTREARIVLSSKVLDSADRLRDTLIHEMCHAATWIIDQVQNGHGAYWKAWAKKAMKVFPELPPIKTCHNYEISTKYVYKCMGCGYSIGRHRKSLDIERKRCGYCFGKFEIFINKTDKSGGQKTVPTPKKEPTGFALFVKENYSNLRVPGKTHAEVMRQLSEEFRKIKV